MPNDVTRTYTVRSGEGAVAASNELSTLLNEWMERAGPPGLFQTCATCRHMTHNAPALCTQYNMVPPVEVIMHGCPTYKDNADIPF